jgi:hypothetical protein
VDNLAQNQQILQQAINDGLLSLGEPIMKTIKWHLAAHGLFIDSKEQVNVRELYNYLEQIVGNIADVVLNEIYASLTQKNGVTLENNNPSESVLSKIEQLVELERKKAEGSK